MGDIETTDRAMFQPHEKLNAREFRVFIAIANGKRLGQIARELCIHYRTVSTYRRRVLTKLGMCCNQQMTAYCEKRGMII